MKKELLQLQVDTDFKQLFSNFEQELFQSNYFYLHLSFHFSNSDEEKKIIRHIAEVLTNNSSEQVPDYYSFQAALRENWNNKPITNTAVYRGMINGEKESGVKLGYHHFILIFTYLYINSIKYIEQSDKAFIDQNSDQVIMLQNKMKLLLSLYEESSWKRIFEGAEALSQYDYESNTDDVADNLEKASSNELMIRLRVALDNNMSNECRIILGALANRSDILTSGEYYYFRAAIELKSGEYKKAIKYAKEIQKNDPDYIQANYIILESFSNLGNADEFFNLYKSLDANLIETAFLLYLLQSLIYQYEKNTEDIDSVFANAISILEDRFQDEKEADIETPNTRIFLRFRAQLSYIYVKEIRAFNLYCAKADINDEAIVTSLFEKMCKKGMSALFALSLEAPYIDGLVQSMMKSDSDVSSYICSQMYIPTELPLETIFADYDITWEIFYELEGAEKFLHNMVNNIKYIGQFPADSRNRWLAICYTTAILYQSDSLNKITEEVKKYAPTLIETTEKNIVEQKIYNSLSTNGKSLFQSATELLNLCINSDYGWKDAGMLSLGFFRIIEYELNERVIKPALKNMDKAVMEFCFTDLKNRKKCNSIHVDTSDSKLGKYNMFTAIAGILKTDWNKKEIKNLMLSEIEYFLNAISDSGNTSEENTLIRKKIQDVFSAVLTDQGMKALREDSWSEMIKHDTRESFRNPPAHAKYLHIDAAIECKQYVFQCLSNMASWINDN